jgi:hypothetical protein
MGVVSMEDPERGDSTDLGVAVSLVDGGVCGEEIEVALAVGVPQEAALALVQHDGQWVVVVGTELVLAVDHLHNSWRLHAMDGRKGEGCVPCGAVLLPRPTFCCASEGALSSPAWEPKRRTA